MTKTPPEVRTIIIENARVQVLYSEMPVGSIHLDPTNPRIQHEVRKRGRALTQGELAKLILDLPGVSDLFRMIRDNGGAMDPIYVRKDGTVIEGNCRAACYMSLGDLKKGDPRWSTIPTLTLPNVTPRQVAVLQAQFHVAGKNKWPAYEKAGHVYDMVKLGMTPDDIATALKVQKRVVERLLQTYETMTTKVLPSIKNGNGLEKWSYVEEFYKRKELDEVRADPAKVTEFIDLVVTGKLKRGEHVRHLNKILANPRAKRALKKENSEEALKVVARTDPTVNSQICRRLAQATKVLLAISTEDIKHLQDNEKSKELLRELHTAIKDVARAASIKLA